MRVVANDPELMSSTEMSNLLSKIELSDEAENRCLASYDQIYPPNWRGDRGAEQRHRSILQRIIEWPKIKKAEVTTIICPLTTLISYFCIIK